MVATPMRGLKIHDGLLSTYFVSTGTNGRGTARRWKIQTSLQTQVL